MDDRDVLGHLAPEVARLLDRHRSRLRPWYPHEMLSSRSATGGALRPAAEAVHAGVRSALVVNLLTEDNLPFYVTALHERFGHDSPWWDWIRQWTAEEARHGMVLRDYVLTGGLLDPARLEQDRMAHVLGAALPRAPSVVAAIAYLAAQELATRVAHHRTGEALDDECGRRVMGRIAADENLHFLFYRDLVNAALDLDPSGTVAAIDDQLRHFAMPGRDVPGFPAHAAAIADAGIFTPATLLDEVLRPLAERHWALFELGGLSPEAERARERLARFLGRLGRVAARLGEGVRGRGPRERLSDAPDPAGGAPGGRS